MSNLCPVRKT